MPPFGCLLLGPVIMAIVLWALAWTGPEHDTKVENPQEASTTEEGDEKKEIKEESSEERNGPSETQSIDLEDKVCFLLKKIYGGILIFRLS